MGLRAYKYRLRPSAKQRVALETTLGLCRQLYNAALEEKRDAYKKQGIGLNCATQQAELTELKLLCPEYAEVYGQVLQNVLKRLHRAFDSFFRRVKTGQTPGYPRFKSADRYDSFTFPQVSGLDRKPSVKVRGVERLPTGRLKVHGVPGDLKVIGTERCLAFRRRQRSSGREGTGTCSSRVTTCRSKSERRQAVSVVSISESNRSRRLTMVLTSRTRVC